MKALVGVTSIPRQARTGFDEVLPHETVPEIYLNLVREAGATPVVLPVHEEFDPDLVERLDGVVLTGGGDVDPSEYRRERCPLTDGIDPRRDRFELSLVRAAVARDLPMLAICRGMQVMNVALGGSLIQDIDAEVPGAVVHHDLERWNRVVHPVRFEPGSLLARLLGDEVDVNSMHHQTIDELGDGLVAVGRSPDGLVEAVEAPGLRCVVGIQWHPECLGAEHSSFKLFRFFADAAREVRT
jgi:gamma-glutamyl-gamma-aminobutyrate hydrolase PuuD